MRRYEYKGNGDSLNNIFLYFCVVLVPCVSFYRHLQRSSKTPKPAEQSTGTSNLLKVCPSTNKCIKEYYDLLNMDGD